MPENSQNADSNEHLLELNSPKTVFYRQHAVPKIYHKPGRYFETHGMVVRGLDMRHTEEKDVVDRFNNKENTVSKRTQRFLNRHTVSYPTRKQIINKDRFGLDQLNLGYSLSKKKRWELADYFEENAKSYQYPNEQIFTVLATTEQPIFCFLSVVPSLFPNPGFWKTDGYDRVKRMISSDENGKLTIRENEQSRGNSLTYLDPLIPANQEPKPKPNRKMSKRQQRLAAAKCQEDPVRITYYLMDPKTTLNFVDSTAQSRWNTSYEKDRLRPNKTRFVAENELELEEYCGNYYNSLDCNGFECEACNEINENVDNQSPCPKPQKMTLADFIQPDIMELIQLESEFDFLQLGIHENFDIDDYVFVDEDFE